MKKLMALLLAMALSLFLSGCGRGDASNVSITNRRSEIYTDRELRSAVDVAIDYFEKEFDCCTLLEIGYIGDQEGKEFIERANQYGVDQVIILVSSFATGPDGGDGSLNPNDTYRNWRWILGRNGTGQWKHLDHGYG